MLADVLEKNHITTYNESITSDQIDLLKDGLQQEIDEKKNQLHQSYVVKRKQINDVDSQTAQLIKQCEQLEFKRNELIKQIEDYSKLESHARHINTNYHHFHNLNKFITGVKQLIQLNDHLHQCRQFCRKGHLNEAKNLYKTIETLIHNEYLFPQSIDKAYQQHYPLYETFQRHVRQIRTEICQTHHNLWNDGVDRSTKNHLTINSEYLDRLFECTFNEDKEEKLLIEKHIQTFASYCFQGFIRILIDKKMNLSIDEEINTVQLRLESNDEIEMNPIERFNLKLNDIELFFNTLNTHLLSKTVNFQPSDKTTTESILIMAIFSSAIVNDFIELIRENLLNIIPNDFEHTEMFRSLLNTINEFEKHLFAIKFFSVNQCSNIFSSVVGNIEESIVKSRCRMYLLEGRQQLQSHAILTTSLQTIEVGDNEELFRQNEEEMNKYKNESSSNLLTPKLSLDELDANMFRFPRTVVIEHVFVFMKFIRSVLDEVDKLERYGVHICTTARNMMELFYVIYPSLHEKKAQELPYLIALHFNTYMFVAHECLILGEEYFHLKHKTGDSQPITFVDYVPLFRNQAANLLKTHLDLQRDTLTSFITEIGAFQNIADEDSNQNILKRAINKCVIHMGSLCHNWRKVFSPQVYFKIIGYLCDHVSQLLIRETLSLEDIPEQECQIMVDAFTEWSTFLQNMLVKDEISPGLNILARLAPNLTRFDELCCVLNSSLQNIVDRWLSGQGPLASQFSAVEVKQLIRALFQTSERRTAALAKIQ